MAAVSLMQRADWTRSVIHDRDRDLANARLPMGLPSRQTRQDIGKPDAMTHASRAASFSGVARHRSQKIP